MDIDVSLYTDAHETRVESVSPGTAMARKGAQPGAHLYVMQAVTGLIKVGRSKNPQRRLRALEQSSGQRIKLLLVLDGRGADERLIHAALAEYRTLGEWFNDTSTCRRAICEALGGVKIGWLYGEGSNLAKARAARLANIQERRRAMTQAAFDALILRIERDGQKKHGRRGVPPRECVVV